jgi:hypothetical protein
MQHFLSRLRSLRRERFDSSTGRRRRGGIAVAAGLALALFVGSGIAVAAVSTASAHTPAINHDCTGVHVQAWDYSDNVVNTVSVTITGEDGSSTVQDRTFVKQFDEWFRFSDPTKAWSYAASIVAPDDTDPNDDNHWSYSWTDTTVPCSAPDISLTATACVHSGDLTTVTAAIGTLDPSHGYTVRLTGTNYDSGDAPIQTTSASWSDLTPGDTYTATLTDTTTGLKATASVVAVGCPEDPAFEITVRQCTIEGPSVGAIDVTVSGLAVGRSYVLALISAAGGAPQEQPFVATAPTYGALFNTSPGGNYTVKITDVVDGTSKTSETIYLLPCPAWFAVTVSAQPCSATDGTRNGMLSWNATSLVPGRSYTLTVVAVATTPGGPTPTVYTESLTPAASSTWSKTLPGFASGIYDVVITDTTAPNGPRAEGLAQIAPCPTQPDVTISASQCTVPGGTGSLTASVGGIAPSRMYVITLFEGAAVANVPDNPQPPQGRGDTNPIVVTWSDLKPGVAYRVLVVDALLPDIKAAADVTLTDCPGNPGIVLTSQCTPLTIADLTVGLEKLIPGENYTVLVSTTADGKSVASQQVAATTATASLRFTQLPVGKSYTIAVFNATKTLTATDTILLTLCDLPTLAYTGASTMTPTLAGLGFLQFGLVLVGISLVRRRSGAREV